MTKLKWMWFVAIPLAVAACTTQYQLLKEPSIWEQACADVKEVDCGEQVGPEIVRDSWLIVKLVGAYGVFVEAEWRIYLAPADYIVPSGETVAAVLYHESIHAVYSLLGDAAPDRCTSERLARKATDKKFGTHSATNGWETWYNCTMPTP